MKDDIKMKKNITILDKFEDVQNWVFEMQKEHNKIIYKGQSNSKWKLNSEFAREEFEKNNHGKEKINDFQYLINCTKKRMEFLKDELGKDVDNFSLFQKMENYQMTTPLIEFSEDILIALWFAASSFSKNKKDSEGNIKIFYKKLDKEEEFKSELQIQDLEFEKLDFFKFKIDKKFERSIVQKSVFVFDTLNLNDQFEFVEIKENLKIEIIKWLDNLGININYLFPKEEAFFQSFNFISYEKYFFDWIREYENGDNKTAIEKIRKAVELKPDYEKAYFNWGITLNQLGKYQSAVKKLERAIELKVDYADAYLNLGYSLNELDKYEEAAYKFKIASELKPNLIEAYFNWGVSLIKLNKYEDAIKKLEKAIELKPDYSDAYLNLGISLNALDKYEDAIKNFKIALELEPDFMEVYFNWGITLNRLNKYEEAIKSLEKAIELNPKYADTYLNLGTSLVELTKYQDGIKKFKKAIELKPDFPEAHLKWGIALNRLNKYQDAIKSFEKAIELNPKYAEAYFNWGISLGELAKYQEAIKKIEKAIKLKPDYADADALLLILKRKLETSIKDK